MTLRHWPLENQYIPPADKKFSAPLGWSEAQIQRNTLSYHVSELLRLPVSAPLFYLQRQRAKERSDLTWTEAFEEFLEARRQDLRHAQKLSREFDEDDYLMGWAITGMKRVLRRAHKAYQEWLEEGRSGLSGHVLLEYRRKVRRYWVTEGHMRTSSTDWQRRKATRLKEKLDDEHNKPEVVALRTRLQIPHYGFQDVDQAACWLYDRFPPDPPLRPYGPMAAVLWGARPGLYEPAIMQVPVLAEATRRLRNRHQLHPEWDVVLCFYLLRGNLDPLPRKIADRKRPKRKKHEQIYELSKKHRHAFKVALSYICGLTDADWAEIREKEPAAKLDRMSWDQMLCIVEEALKIAERKKRTLRPRDEWIRVANVRKIRSRIRAEGKM